MVRFDGDSCSSVRFLSSGERQILSMLYAATYQSDRGRVVLIDEPELSLHIDWQRKLLDRMAQQLGQRQIIVCTHSPEIGADHDHDVDVRAVYRPVGCDADQALVDDSGEVI